MSVTKIKQYLSSQEKMKILLIRLGLYDIKLEQNGTLFTCGLPNSDNQRSVQIRMDSNLTLNIRNRNIYGDIIDLVSYVKFDVFGEKDQETLFYLRQHSIKWLIGSLDGDFDEFEASDEFKYLYEREDRDFSEPNEPYNENLLMEFSTIYHSEWVKEGLSPDTLRSFGIMFDHIKNHVIIPCRNTNGKLVQIKARRMGKSNYNGMKYYTVLKPTSHNELYGLWKTLPYIKKKKQIILFESEKSVMKAWQYGYKNSIALATNNLGYSQKLQLKEIIKDGYEVVIALDNDMEIIDIKEISNKLKDLNVDITYIRQTNGDGSHIKLDEKDSPVDKGKKLFKRLYNNRKGLI